MNRIVILIVLLMNSVYFAGATRNNYKTVTREDIDLCLPGRDTFSIPRISLRESQPALLVTQLSLGKHRTYWHYKTGFDFDMHCHFIVDVEKQPSQWLGVYAVIQNLNFRYDAVNNECIDYIKFTSLYGVWTEKICGTHNTTRSISNVGFVGSNAKMEVVIHINKDSPVSKTDMSIAFTLFEEGYPCRESYAKCGKKNECILSDLFDDGIVNCPYKFGHDEWTLNDWYIQTIPTFPPSTERSTEKTRGIPPTYSIDTNHSDLRTPTLNTDAIIAATTVVALTIVLSVTCLLIYWRRSGLSSQRSPVADVANREAPLITTARPSAPPSNVDKESPPPYDTVNIV